MNGPDATHKTNIVPPHGLEQIRATFGDIQKYILHDGTLDPSWQTKFLSFIVLPFPLMLSFDHSTTITHFTCHKLLIEVFADVFEQIVSNGLQAKITNFGGCFAFRSQRAGTKLSTHSWGIAIDLNPETNPAGHEWETWM